jgi:hypothetical protein
MNQTSQSDNNLNRNNTLTPWEETYLEGRSNTGNSVNALKWSVILLRK